MFIRADILYWQRNIPSNDNIPFQASQVKLKYTDELMAIDWIYKEASGKPFAFKAYTIPYLLPQAWEYLFWYYGNGTYHSLPTDTNYSYLFAIIQSDTSNQVYQNEWLKDNVYPLGKETTRFRTGELLIKRLEVNN